MKKILLVIISLVLTTNLTFGKFIYFDEVLDDNAGTNSENFLLDMDDTSTTEINLSFGSSLESTLQYNFSLDSFIFSKDLSLAGNELTDFRVENSDIAVGCDVNNKGRMYYNTTENKPFYCNGTEWVDFGGGDAGSTGGNVLALAQFVDSQGGLDINQTTIQAIPFLEESRKDDGISHEIVNPSQIILDNAGAYRLSYNVSADNTSNARRTIKCQVRKNGIELISSSISYAYSRNTTDDKTTNTATILLETTNDNEYFEIMCMEAGSSGEALTIINESWVFVEKLGIADGSGGSSLEGIGQTAVLQNNESITITHEENDDHYLHISSARLVTEGGVGDNSSLDFDEIDSSQFTKEDVLKTTFIGGVLKLLSDNQDSFARDFSDPNLWSYDGNEVVIENGEIKIEPTLFGTDIVGYWRFENDRRLYDSSGNEHILTQNGTASFVTGSVGDGFDQNNSDTLRLETDPDFNLTETGSLSLWMNYQNKTEYGGLIHSGDNDSWADESYSLQWRNNGQMALILSDNLGNDEFYYFNEDFQADTWYHIVATWNQSTVKFFVDGQLDMTSTNTILVQESGGGLSVGCQLSQETGDARYIFEGKLDEVVISNQYFDQTMVDELYNNGDGQFINPFPTEPIVLTTTTALGTDNQLEEYIDFTEIAGTDNAGDLEYQFSVDGTNWLYWNGSSWSSASFDNRNTATVIKNNISEFPTTNQTIWTKVFLISDGTEKVSLESVTVDYDRLSYDTTESFVVNTTDENNIVVSSWGDLQSVSLTQTTPVGTDLRYLVSFDGRSTWKTYTAGNWQTVSDQLDGEIAFSKALNKTNLEQLSVTEWNKAGGFETGTTQTLDFAIYLQTNDETETPELDQITVSYFDGEQIWRKIYGTDADNYPIDFIDSTHTKITNQSGVEQTIKLFVR